MFMLHCDMRFNRARLVVVTLPALPQTLLRRRLLPAGLHYPMEASRTMSPGFVRKRHQSFVATAFKSLFRRYAMYLSY